MQHNESPGALAGASGAKLIARTDDACFSTHSTLRASASRWASDFPIGGLAGDAAEGVDLAAFVNAAKIGDGLQAIVAPRAVSRPVIFSGSDLLVLQRALGDADFTILRGHFDLIGLLNLGGGEMSVHSLASSRDVWPAPDMRLLSGGEGDAPSLPLQLLGANLGGEIAALAEAKSAPVDYVAGGVLAIGAALIGNARWIEAWSGWREPCALWIGCVGGPSSSKSPGLDPSLACAREIECESAEAFETIIRRWETDREAAKLAEESWRDDVRAAREAKSPPPAKPKSAMEPIKPARPRVVVGDTTSEELGAILSGNPKGLCLFRDELSGFITGLGRYGNDADRAFFIEAFGGRSFTIDRRKFAEPIIIPRLTLSILGGIQPDRMNSLLIAGDNDGFASRFAFVWPDPSPPVRPAAGYGLANLRRAFSRLHSLQMADAPLITVNNGGDASLSERDPGATMLSPVITPLSREAQDAHEASIKKLYERTKEACGLYASHLGKGRGLALRLAGVLEFLDWAFGPEGAPEPAVISLAATERAWALCEEYFEPMALRVYGDAAISKTERDAAAIVKRIYERKELTINARVIRQSWRIPGLREAAKVDAALAFLVEAGWVREAASRQGGSPGRRAKNYEVNPDVF